MRIHQSCFRNPQDRAFMDIPSSLALMFKIFILIHLRHSQAKLMKGPFISWVSPQAIPPIEMAIVGIWGPPLLWTHAWRHIYSWSETSPSTKSAVVRNSNLDGHVDIVAHVGLCFCVGTNRVCQAKAVDEDAKRSFKL